jgi:hypothetical protein
MFAVDFSRCFDFHLVRSISIGVLISFCLFTENVLADETAYRKTAEVEGVTEYQLNNGCRVVLIPDESSSSITVNMIWRSGNGSLAGAYAFQRDANPW